MFIGHFALALGAKKFAPQVSLGILFLACQLADIIWPNLVLLGFEALEIEPGITVMTPLNFLHYPYSHSLVALILWSAIFAVLYALLRRSGTKYRYSLSRQLNPVSRIVGENQYTRHTKPLDRQGSIGFWALTLFLFVVYAASLLGPPPPSATAAAWAAQALWLVIAWGFWVDHHRVRKSDG